MKIAFIGQKGIPSISGGIEKHVEGLAVALAHHGHDVFVYTRKNYTPTHLKEYQGVKLISLPSISTKNLDAISHTFFAVIDLIRRPVDIVHFHGIGPSSLLWLVKCVKPRAQVIATFHCQDYFHKKWGAFGRWYLKFGEWVTCTKADATIVVSKSLAAYTEKTYQSDPTYIPNGVTVVEKNIESNLTSLDLEKDGYILAVSRLIPHKGLHHLIKAYKNIITDKKLVIVGSGSYTDDYVQHLQILAKADSRVCLLGAKTGDELVDLFTHAYAFVQPSESEGLSIALLEAMSHGLASLVSDIPENLEAIGQTGFSFTCNDEDSLKLALETMLNQPEQVKQVGQLAKQRVKDLYNWEMITTMTEKVYAEQVTKQLEQQLSKTSFLTRFSTFL